MNSRRRFILYSGATALTTVLAAAIGASEKSVAKEVLTLAKSHSVKASSSDVLHPNDFRSLQQQVFQLHQQGGKRVKLVLDQVTEKALDPHVEQFSVGFRAPANVVLEQGSYVLEHPKLGKTKLLMVPDGSLNKGNHHYTVTFSNLLS